MAETGQPYAYTGDDPVNGVDPLGLFCLLGNNPGGGCRGGSEAAAFGRGALSAVECLQSDCEISGRGAANLAAGFANSAAQFVDGALCSDSPDCPSWSVPAPYPCSASGSYQLGEGLFFGAGFFIPGGDAGDLAGAGLGDAAEAGEGVPFAQNNLNHIFRDAPGHLSQDTLTNRELLQGAVQPDNYVGTNAVSGVSTYRELLPNGQQVWVEVRKGVISNGGVNINPR